jgi:hypothetical protein
MVWGIKKKGLHVTNLLLFRLVFCLFQLFRNTETPCFDIKAKNQNKRLVSDSAKTSFGCFDRKLVSEDTLVASGTKSVLGSDFGF